MKVGNILLETAKMQEHLVKYTNSLQSLNPTNLKDIRDNPFAIKEFIKTLNEAKKVFESLYKIINEDLEPVILDVVSSDIDNQMQIAWSEVEIEDGIEKHLVPAANPKYRKALIEATTRSLNDFFPEELEYIIDNIEEERLKEFDN